MNFYQVTATIGLAALTAGIYLTIGLGPALIVFGGLLMVASLIAGRGASE